MPLPTLTNEQRAAAAARATAARRVRAEVRASLRSSAMSVSEVLQRASSDDAVAKLRVITVLESLPGIGKVKAESAMSRLGIAMSRRLKGLGPNQVAALTREFG
ncbi:MAG: integration host factor, actinobacterial type [Candidatus Nanopelagicales bacterium]|nr:30S ribosomal protein S13 [Candidatus Nanopelagicales bacterium]